MIGENSGTKSAKMRPAKIEQTADLQKWFNDSSGDACATLRGNTESAASSKDTGNITVKIMESYV